MYENAIMKPLFCVLAFREREDSDSQAKETYLLSPRKSQWVSEQECNMTRGRLVNLADWTEEGSSCLEWAPCITFCFASYFLFSLSLL